MIKRNTKVFVNSLPYPKDILGRTNEKVNPLSIVRSYKNHQIIDVRKNQRTGASRIESSQNSPFTMSLLDITVDTDMLGFRGIR